MYDVVTLGESFVDFTPIIPETPMAESQGFKKNAGGAVANVACGVASLGGKAAFLGKMGEDPFGEFLFETLKGKGVDVSGVKRTKEAQTKLAFVNYKTNGDRDFVFWGKPSADEIYREDEIEYSLLDNAKIFHFGSISLIAPDSYDATMSAIRRARTKGALISYDPNVRPKLWPSKAEAKEKINEGLNMADIIKIADTELKICTSTDDPDEGLERLSFPGAKIALVTAGEGGVYYKWHNNKGFLPAYKVKSVDTTGAGDSFVASLLYQISRNNTDIEKYTDEQVREVLDFAERAGAIVVTKPGAIPSMPTYEEVKNFKCETY
ncbi:MAG: carbohydrate kinase [Armatimonadetes bacterium]|nr:carbohydrate kinase [Candidatus Hippobium faecium]